MPFLTDDLHTRMVAIRRDLHQHPEIAHQEHRTAGIVADHLRALGMDDLRTGVGQTGVVATLKGGRPGRTVLLRADMDALPLQELDRGQPYRSLVDGAHHGCGHDGHVAIMLTVATILAERRAEIPGTVVFLFQPAEERVGGAEGMLADGALESPVPDACFALHLWNNLPVGTVGVRTGPVFANADAFGITLTGPGGHGGQPHQTRDPIVVASVLIGALQTLVSRETPPLEPSVFTIGSIHGGTASNIIPTRVEMMGTLRTFDADVRERLLERLESLVAGTASMFDLEWELTPGDSCPACLNDPAMSDLVRATTTRLFGPDALSETFQTTGADDMSLFLNAVPGCYFVVGSANPERGLDGPHHSPHFDFDEAALSAGVELMTSVALDYLTSRH